jgi:predicted nucleotidyltransferase
MAMDARAQAAKEVRMADLKTVVVELRDTLTTQLGEHVLALYLTGSAARGSFVPGRSDIDLLLVVDPDMQLADARRAFRPLVQRYGELLHHGPMVATPEDLASHLALFPVLHRNLQSGAVLLAGKPLLKGMPAPPPEDPIEDAAYVAARAITYATVLTPHSVSEAEARRLRQALDRMTRRVASNEASSEPARELDPIQAIVALHAKLREWSNDMPQFDWRGTPPSGDLPDLLPDCLAFYQREKHLITVLERVDYETLTGVDWDEVGAAAEDAYALFGLATPWQLRLAASRMWVDSLFFSGFDHMWGADILEGLVADEGTLLHQLASVSSEQRVEKVPGAYLSIDDDAIGKLIHDTQNVLLNAGLRAELYARFSGRAYTLSEWTPPGREVPQPERVAATWERWRELTAYYVNLWREVSGTADESSNPTR